jgi:hypothetical protein
MARSNRKSPPPCTEEHRKHLSQSIKRWWSVPENKERMRRTHIGRHFGGGWSLSEAQRKQISETLKQYWKNRRERDSEE